MGEQKFVDLEIEDAVQELISKGLIKRRDKIYCVLGNVTGNKEELTKWVLFYVIKENKPYRIIGPIPINLDKHVGSFGEGVVGKLNHKLKEVTGKNYHLRCVWL